MGGVDGTLTFPDTARSRLRCGLALQSIGAGLASRWWNLVGGFSMKRGLVSAVLLSLIMLVPAQLAMAGEKWCEADPVLTIDGRIVDYTASFPSTYLKGTTVNWTFHIPKNVLLAAAITPPALGSPTIAATVRIVRDQPAYWLLANATVITTVTFSSTASFDTKTSVKGLNARWTTYLGRSNKTLTFATGYSTLPLLF
jgi:hypothetical protein